MADLISAFQKRTRDDMRRDQNAPESESPRPLRDQRVPGSRDYEQWRRQGRWHWFRKTTSSSGPSSPPLGVNTKKAVDQGQGLMHRDVVEGSSCADNWMQHDDTLGGVGGVVEYLVHSG